MTDDPRTKAVRRALETLPVSRREIARRAGLTHTTLNRIASGDGRATDDVARAVADALEGLERRVARVRHGIRHALADTEEA